MASQMNSGNSKVKSNEHVEPRNLDLDQLVQDVQAVVCSALNEKLKRVYDMHREYKETHDAVMQIPAVRKLVHSSADMGGTTPSGCEEIQQLIAENASLKAKVSELENSILKMMDAHIATELDESECESESDSEPENITLVIQETEEEMGENEEPGIVDTVIPPVVTEEEDDDVTNESEEEEEDEEDEEEDAPITVQLKPTVAEAQAESEDEEEEAEDEDEDEEEEVDASNEEVEVIETEINGKPYFTTDETSGVIYECRPDGDIGDEVGKFVGGKAVFG